MNHQNNFLQNIIPFLLIMLLIAVAFFVYKKNPEIMNPEPYYKVLQKQGELAASHIVYSPTREGVFTMKAHIETNSSSHRYTEMNPDVFKAVPLRSQKFEWEIWDQKIIVVEKGWVSVSALDGTPIWSFRAPAATEFTPGPLCIYGDVLFLTTTAGRIYAFDTQTGHLIWYIESALQFLHSPLLSKDQLILLFSEKANPTWRYQILDSHTGNLIFRSENIEQPLVGSPLVKDDILYFSTRGGHLKSVFLDRGKTNWSAEGSSNFIGKLSFAGDRILVSDESALLLGFDTSDGQRTNEVVLQNPFINAPIPVEESSLVVGITADLSLVGIDLKGGKTLWKHPLNIQKDSTIDIRLVNLSSQSLNQLSFNSKARGWTAWAPCNTTNICIYDVKSGLLLSRMDLKGRPLSKFELIPAEDGAPGRLLIPLLRGDHAQIVGFTNPSSNLTK